MIVGLLISGATAIPLQTELDWLAGWAGGDQASGEGLAGWFHRVREALRVANQNYPFLAYGTDWLAFGHFVIALAFVGALRDPVRNRWLFDWGLIACALIIPYALVMGGVRGIPFWWRLIDCSFGILGAVPLWLARRWTRALPAPAP